MDWSVPVDPQTFQDPFALKVGWDSIGSGAANFSDHQLERVDSNRIKFVMSGAAIRFCRDFQFLGLVVLLLGFWGLLKVGHGLGIFVLPGAGCLAIGIAFAKAVNTSFVFDAKSRLFWKGSEVTATNPPISFDQIYALQLLTRRVLTAHVSGSTGSGANYLSYELNLVLKDRSRIPVIHSGEIARIREDAQTVSAFLSVPLWDGAKTETECLAPDAPPLRVALAHAIDNKDKAIRYAAIPQAIVGALFVYAGFFTGHVPLHLLQNGVLTQGKVVDVNVQTTALVQRHGAGGWHSYAIPRRQPVYMPVIEFEADGRRIRFQNRFNALSDVRNRQVSILYDPLNPSTAMMNESGLFYLPWAPLFAIGLFFLLVAVKGWYFPKKR